MRKIKILSTILFLLICLFVPFSYGCSDNDFIQVRSITYSIGGETKTLHSTVEYCFKDSQSISKEEYYAAPFEQRYQKLELIALKDPDPLNANYVLPSSHKGKESFREEPDKKDPDECIYYTIDENLLQQETYYRKSTFTGKLYKYVCIRYKNDNTLIIKYDGKETTCINANVQITHF